MQARRGTGTREPGRRARRAGTPWRSRAVAALAALAAGGAEAQSPSLAELALSWSTGAWISPLHCRFGERSVRGVRRVEIEPGRRDLHKPVNRIRFVDLDAADAERCFDDLGRPQPNLTGRLRVRYAGTAHRATALRDLRVALEREGGFDFAVVDGRLRIEPIGDGAAREVELRGARLRIEQVRPGTDPARLLADLPPGRRHLLTIEGPDDLRIELPLAESERR